MFAQCKHGSRGVTIQKRTQNFIVLFGGLFTATFDRIDEIKGISRPEDLHEMQRLRHVRDAVHAPVKPVVDSARGRPVTDVESLFELIREGA